MLKISNNNIKLLWLSSNYLLNIKKQKLDVLQIIKNLGFVQIDSIQNVTRAQHHILWSRNKEYKEHLLDDLLAKKGSIFEHFTHDASLIPLEFYPMWKDHFVRTKQRLDKSKYYKDLLDVKARQNITSRLKNEGALHSKDFDSSTLLEKKMWSRSQTKTTLDYMWYCGELSTAYRKSFRKYYDLVENIIPSDILNKKITSSSQIDWLCLSAIERLGVASAKEIKNFWASLSLEEVNLWLLNNEKKFLKVQWETHEGKYINSFASLDIEKKLTMLKTKSKNSSKIQIINPFDPAIRDRLRLKKIFGFEYKIEIFVPKEKRVWGYYVYPLLEESKFIARIEIQANRKTKELNIINYWVEEGFVWNDEKQAKLDEELLSFASLIGISNISWLNS